jgi:hypothetical protein
MSDSKSDSSKVELPKTAAIEAVVSALQAGAGLIPFVGSPIAAAVGFGGLRIIEKRQTVFFEAVVHGLDDVQLQVTEFRESFWTILFHAAEIARRTHEQEKIEALKNAVVHAALPDAPDDVEQHIFVNMVGDFTTLHVRVLNFIVYPQMFGMNVEDYRGLHALNPYNPQAAWDAIDNIVGVGRRDLVQLCFSEMVSRGLLEYRSRTVALQGAMLPWPTSLAWRFLHFITSDEAQRGTEASSG